MDAIVLKITSLTGGQPTDDDAYFHAMWVQKIAFFNITLLLIHTVIVLASQSLGGESLVVSFLVSAMFLVFGIYAAQTRNRNKLLLFGIGGVFSVCYTIVVFSIIIILTALTFDFEQKGQHGCGECVVMIILQTFILAGNIALVVFAYKAFKRIPYDPTAPTQKRVGGYTPGYGAVAAAAGSGDNELDSYTPHSVL